MHLRVLGLVGALCGLLLTFGLLGRATRRPARTPAVGSRPAAGDAGGSTVARGVAGVSIAGGDEVGVSTAGGGLAIATVAGDDAEGPAGSVSLGTIKTKPASADRAATTTAAPMLSRRTPRRGTFCRCCWSGGAPCHNQSPEASSSGATLRAGGSTMTSLGRTAVERGDPIRMLTPGPSNRSARRSSPLSSGSLRPAIAADRGLADDASTAISAPKSECILFSGTSDETVLASSPCSLPQRPQTLPAPAPAKIV